MSVNLDKAMKPLIYKSKKRVWIKYNARLLRECFGCSKAINYGVITSDYFEKYENEIINSFNNDLKLAMFEKKTFDKIFIRVLNQDIITQKNGSGCQIAMKSKSYKGIMLHM